jgi:hypothetical protein
MLADRLTQSMKTIKNFNQLAMQSQAKIDTFNLAFGGYNNSAIGREPEIVGKLFTCKAGEMIGPLKGKFGAYVAIIDHINNVPEKQDFTGEKMQQESGFANRANGMIYDAIKKAGKIIDYRKNFF